LAAGIDALYRGGAYTRAARLVTTTNRESLGTRSRPAEEQGGRTDAEVARKLRAHARARFAVTCEGEGCHRDVLQITHD